MGSDHKEYTGSRHLPLECGSISFTEHIGGSSLGVTACFSCMPVIGMGGEDGTSVLSTQLPSRKSKTKRCRCFQFKPACHGSEALQGTDEAPKVSFFLCAFFLAQELSSGPCT